MFRQTQTPLEIQTKLSRVQYQKQKPNTEDEYSVMSKTCFSEVKYENLEGETFIKFITSRNGSVKKSNNFV